MISEVDFPTYDTKKWLSSIFWKNRNLAKSSILEPKWGLIMKSKIPDMAYNLNQLIKSYQNL